MMTKKKPKKSKKALKMANASAPGPHLSPWIVPPRCAGSASRNDRRDARGDILARRPWRSGRAASLPPPPHLQQKNVLVPPNCSPVAKYVHPAAAASPNCSPVEKYVHPALPLPHTPAPHFRKLTSLSQER